MRDWIYDLECYPNCFTVAIVRADGKHERVFEMSNFNNESEGFLNCIKYLIDNEQRMVGFNNLGFDYPIVHELYKLHLEGSFPKTGRMIAKKAYSLAQKQIDATKGGGFPNIIWDNDQFVQQLDLYKIHHFDRDWETTFQMQFV